MNCEEAREYVQEAMDEALSAEHASELERHAAVCPSCKAYAAEMAALADDLRLLRESTELPSDYQPGARRSGGAARRVARVAAVIALMIGGGVFVRSRVAPDPAQPPASNARAVAATRFEPRVTLSPSDEERYIALPQSTENPRVHIVWLHATLTGPRNKERSNGDSAATGERQTPVT